MYFKESECIARKEKFPKYVIKKIDRFLARKHVKSFKLHDVWDLADVHENAKPILDEYVKCRVLKLTKRYFCPKHENNAIEVVGSLPIRRKGFCEKCDDSYFLIGLQHEIMYKRIKEPRQWSNSEDLTQSHRIEVHEPQWKPIAKFVAKTVAATIIGYITINVFVAGIQNLLSTHTFENQTTRQITPSFTHAISSTLAPEPNIRSQSTLTVVTTLTGSLPSATSIAIFPKTSNKDHH